MVWLRAEFNFLQNGTIKTSGDALEALLCVFVRFHFFVSSQLLDRANNLDHASVLVPPLALVLLPILVFVLVY
jgi:hypothetical protein